MSGTVSSKATASTSPLTGRTSPMSTEKGGISGTAPSQRYVPAESSQ
ncbi:MAG: hypothetical protein PUA78_04145 [Porphyromonadaceae bacterium]|nr:hypothetical protein [Porphyromonadaceae bacterium]